MRLAQVRNEMYLIFFGRDHQYRVPSTEHRILDLGILHYFPVFVTVAQISSPTRYSARTVFPLLVTIPHIPPW